MKLASWVTSIRKLTDLQSSATSVPLAFLKMKAGATSSK